MDKLRLSDGEKLDEVHDNVKRLLRENQDLTTKVEKLERQSNASLRAETIANRVERNKEKLNDLNGEVMFDMQKMILVKDKLHVDGETDIHPDVDWFYQTQTFDRLTHNEQVGTNGYKPDQRKRSSPDSKSLTSRSTQTKEQGVVLQSAPPVKKTSRTPLRSPSQSSKSSDSSSKSSTSSRSSSSDSSSDNEVKVKKSTTKPKTTTKTSKSTSKPSHRSTVVFNNTGKEEKMDMYFGKNGDYSSKALRSFIERYKMVKEINISNRMKGWDSPSYRADKVKMALAGDPYSYVSFESSMNQSWTRHDDKILSKLKDRYMSIQAVELSILQFEQRSQGSQESFHDFMSTLRVLASEAYDGDSQTELNRKVAWKFVSGIYDDGVRVKVMEAGWMQNRREAKPLTDLLKIAEATRTKDYRRR